MADKYDQHWVASLFDKARWAITLFGTTYYSVPESEVTASWRRHEECHKQQQAREGFMFYVRYLIAASSKGYDLNPYEIEARAAERDNNVK